MERLLFLFFVSLSLLYPAVLFLLLMPTASPYNSLCFQSAFPLTSSLKASGSSTRFYSWMLNSHKHFNLRPVMKYRQCVGPCRVLLWVIPELCKYRSSLPKKKKKRVCSLILTTNLCSMCLIIDSITSNYPELTGCMHSLDMQKRFSPS